MPVRLRGSVEFRNVTFGYNPVAPPLISDLSFTVRPHAEIYNLHWKPPPNQPEEGRLLVRQNQIDVSGRLTNCSTCHR